MKVWRDRYAYFKRKGERDEEGTFIGRFHQKINIYKQNQ